MRRPDAFVLIGATAREHAWYRQVRCTTDCRSILDLSPSPCWTPHGREIHFTLPVEILKQPDLVGSWLWTSDLLASGIWLLRSDLRPRGLWCCVVLEVVAFIDAFGQKRKSPMAGELGKNSSAWATYPGAICIGSMVPISPMADHAHCHLCPAPHQKNERMPSSEGASLTL